MEQQSRWLLAWLNESEAVSVLLGGAPAPDRDIREQQRSWQEARAALMRRPAFRQSSVLSKVPGKLQQRTAAFQQRPDVIEALEGLQWTIGIVDLRCVLSFQRVVAHEDGTNRACAVVPEDPNSLFSFCLPDPGIEVRASGTIDQANKAITFSSQNRNFRIGDPLIVDLDVSSGPGLPIRKQKCVGFTVGFSMPFVQVIEFGGRWFLRDGYHRCYGLLRRSIYRIPCILIRARDFAETGAAAPGFFSHEILFGDRPPFVVDFLDDSVARTTHRLAQQKVIRVAASEFVVER
jgi:hypothetical protein